MWRNWTCPILITGILVMWLISYGIIWHLVSKNNNKQPPK